MNPLPPPPPHVSTLAMVLHSLELLTQGTHNQSLLTDYHGFADLSRTSVKLSSIAELAHGLLSSYLHSLGWLVEHNADGAHYARVALDPSADNDDFSSVASHPSRLGTAFVRNDSDHIGAVGLGNLEVGTPIGHTEAEEV